MSIGDNSPAEAWRRLSFGALLALTFLLGCFPMGEFDTWWHVRTGQLILEQGQVPRVDFLTYTNAGRPWIDLYWLFQIVLAGLFRLGGPSALVLLKAAVGTAIVALSLFARARGTKAWPALLAWLAPVVMLTGRLCERPELVSLLAMASFLTLLSHAGRHPRWLWFLPLGQVLWVNCHGFFVLGPLVFLAFVAEQVYERLRASGTVTGQPPVKTVAIVGVSIVLACLVNPYGAGAIRLPLEQLQKLGKSGLYRANISELRTVGDFIGLSGVNNPYLLAYFAVLLLGIASFIAAGRRKRLRVFRLLLFVAAAYLGWQATRNSALCAVMAAFVTLWNLDDALATTAEPVPVPPSTRRSRQKRQPEKRAAPRSYNPLALVAVAVLAFGTLTGKLYAWGGEGRTIGLGERPQWYAHESCAFMARSDMPERIVAYNLSQAAVCIAHASPAHKLFMDPRLEVNDQQTFERYLDGIRKLWRGQPGWEEPLGIDYKRVAEMPAILIERGILSRAADVLALDPRWRCVHADPVAVVFVAADFADAHGLPEAQR